MKNTLFKYVFLIMVFTMSIVLITCTKDNPITKFCPVQVSLPIIPNNDFENWTFDPQPENWETNSCPLCVPPLETYIVQKDSQEVYHGKFSMKLIYNDIFPAWAKTKFPATVHPLNLKAYVKCNLFGQDTVSIKVDIFYHGNVVDMGKWIGTSSLNVYTLIDIPISHESKKLDSIMITINGGHEIKGLQGSGQNNNTEFWVDYLSF